MKIEIERFWINQPSTNQPLHKYHGTNVLGVVINGKVDRVYNASGKGAWVSSQVPDSPPVLSEGWLIGGQDEECFDILKSRCDKQSKLIQQYSETFGIVKSYINSMERYITRIKDES